jgi:NAD(P)-dependent dehydrogenase (short-subunit alcohol dehydrogenase family)
MPPFPLPLNVQTLKLLWAIAPTRYKILVAVAVLAVARKLYARANRKSLADEVVLITGAGSGIGRLLAFRLAKLRARLILCAYGVDRVPAAQPQRVGGGAPRHDELHGLPVAAAPQGVAVNTQCGPRAPRWRVVVARPPRARRSATDSGTTSTARVFVCRTLNSTPQLAHPHHIHAHTRLTTSLRAGDLNGQAVADVARTIVAEGGVARAYQCDVSDREAVYALVRQCTEDAGGNIGVLINNAGIVSGKHITETADESVVRTFNVRRPLAGSLTDGHGHRCVRMMRLGGGCGFQHRGAQGSWSHPMPRQANRTNRVLVARRSFFYFFLSFIVRSHHERR